MTTAFKVFYDWQGSRNISVVIYAETPEAAANKLRKQAPGAIVHKVKVDKSGNVSPRGKTNLANEIERAAKEKGYKVFRHRAELVPQTDMIGTNGVAVNIVNGRNGTFYVDEYDWFTKPNHQ